MNSNAITTKITEMWKDVENWPCCYHNPICLMLNMLTFVAVSTVFTAFDVFQNTDKSRRIIKTIFILGMVDKMSFHNFCDFHSLCYFEPLSLQSHIQNSMNESTVFDHLKHGNYL